MFTKFRKALFWWRLQTFLARNRRRRLETASANTAALTDVAS